jgi:hypothetical protein
MVYGNPEIQFWRRRLVGSHAVLKTILSASNPQNIFVLEYGQAMSFSSDPNSKNVEYQADSPNSDVLFSDSFHKWRLCEISSRTHCVIYAQLGFVDRISC